MKGNLIRAILILCLLCFELLPISHSWAVPIESIPNPRRNNGTWVSDVANILSAETESRLNQRISQLEVSNGSEIAVVTIPDASPNENVKAYATKLFNTWGIGKRGFDNGVLFLIAVKERRIEIETGRGVTLFISNDQVAEIIASRIRPRFQEQNFDLGILNGVNAVADRLEKINFANAAFTPDYYIIYVIGAVGIAIAIAGIGWIILKINRWCQLCFSTNKPVDSSLIFPINIQSLRQFASLPMQCIAVGVGAIAVSISMLLSPHPFTEFALDDEQFRHILQANFLILLATIPLWFGIAYYWVAQLTKTIQKESSDKIWILFGEALVKNLVLLCILESLLLLVSAILTSSSVASFLSAAQFPVISFMIAIANQLFLVYVVDQVSLNDEFTQTKYFCATCRTPAQELDSSFLSTYLTQPEQQAIALGNATYSLYTCDRCHPEINQKSDRQYIYCLPHILETKSICSKCGYPTLMSADLSQSRELKKFPQQESQDAVSILQCQNCLHEEPVYPQKISSTSTSYGDQSPYDSSSYSGSYDSSSSSDFGGGSSDGGGSGSDW
ncbi:MAG: hypothetical protein DCE90_10080 [Pseudanabaena sp.]|nr:MAG: hypothetical protein DCE90_10080 [Pseudanabaena sp.]